tara:strand:- start:6707 stop:7984 length:1278 start_codon:yes stop_codon:yes gene_type:complete
MDLTKINLSVIGLGYVGLPLAVEFGKSLNVIGYDISENRIDELKSNFDKTLELNSQQIKESKGLSFTSKIDELSKCNAFIVTVPTPIDSNNEPNLEPLINASKMVGNILKKNDTIIYESTVFPGATEEVCVPILEQFSGLKFNVDFFVGYSPERINPGDKEHTITKIKKVTSGSSPETASFVDDLYSSIITAGTYKAPSIKVAEAAKVIENTQRDLNIALINELAIIFNKLNIDTEEVLNAAGTKWNFLNFRPGLVGGHCIGVDPYYLTYKSQSEGYQPEIILAGRKLNDGMGEYVAIRLIDELIQKGIKASDARILIMGYTFKENCPDIRNTKVINIINKLIEYDAEIDVFDPWASSDDINLINASFSYVEEPLAQTYDAIIIAVSHDKFIKMGINNIKKFAKDTHIIFDLKYSFSKEDTDLRL